MLKLILVLLLVVSCGKDGDVGPQGLPGPDGVGEVGEAGADGLAGLNGINGYHDLLMLASRYYSTTIYASYERVVTADRDIFVRLPRGFHVITGNAGRGWVSITVNDYRFCYRGISPRVIDESMEFRINHMKPILGSNTDDCSNDDRNEPVNFPEDVELILEPNQLIRVIVHGGGCGGFCEDTTVLGLLEML